MQNGRWRSAPAVKVERTMLRTLQAAEIAGIRAFAVHAKDDDAKAFYERFDFLSSPSDPYHLFRLMKDVRAKHASDKTASGKD